MTHSSNSRPKPVVRTILAVIGLAAVLAMPPVVAGQYYRWIDSSGNLYIGDQPPPGGVVGTRALRLPEYAPPERSPQDDPYSIINQTKRLEEQRQARAREREEKRRAEREYLLRKRELEAMREPPPQPAVPVYVYPQIHHYGRPPHRPWHPHPDHPHLGHGGRKRSTDIYKEPRPGSPRARPGRRFELVR